MEKTAAITLKNATLGYRKSDKAIPVLQGINLEFNTGELIGLVGVNGTGKSTLLRSICGLQPALGGEILISSQPLTSYPLSTLAKKVAVVLTEKIGGFNLTAYDAVAAGQVPYTDSFHRLNATHKAVIDKAIAVSGIRAHQHKPLGELSDGLFQKTMIAKALAQQTETILLDEPSAFLDYASKHELFLLLKALCHTEQKCVVVSSHDLDLLLKYCDRLLILSDTGMELIAASEAMGNKAFREIGGGFL